MNQSTVTGTETFRVNVPSFLPTDTTSTVGFVLSTLLLALVVSFLYDSLAYSPLTNAGRWLSNQPWIVNSSHWFAKSAAEERSVHGFRQMIDEGYKNFSKKGKAFVVPMKGSPPLVILPPSEVRNLLNQPDSKLDEQKTQQEVIQSKYTIKNSRVSEKGVHVDVIRRELTRKLPLLTNDVSHELSLGMQKMWSSSATETNTVYVYPTVMQIVSRAANRVFAGKDLCRNDEFLEHSKLYAQAVFGGAAKLNLYRWWTRPFAAPFVMWSNRRNIAVCRKHAEPVIRERLEKTGRKLKDPDFEWEAPNDALQWMIELIFERGEPAGFDVPEITLRLLTLNMVAIHTTSMVMANVMLDVFSAPDTEAIQAGLRDECERVLARHGGDWSKNAINELVRCDSAIRETMRFSDLGSLGLNRTVVAPEGIRFGPHIHVPRGVRVAIPASSLHHDDAFYPDAARYDPFRFSAPREHYEAAKVKDMQRALELKNQSLITVGDSFLSFGNGRHACPGRFFAAQEMKLMLAEIVMNYDIELLGRENGRPPNIPMGNSSLPSFFAQIKVKRRS